MNLGEKGHMPALNTEPHSVTSLEKLFYQLPNKFSSFVIRGPQWNVRRDYPMGRDRVERSASYLHVGFSAHSAIMKMEAISSTETSVNFYHTTRHHTLEHSTFLCYQFKTKD
jgi:hypothetical protein